MGCGASKTKSDFWEREGGEEFRHVLKGGSRAPVRLVDARFLIKLGRKGGRLAHRQALPEKAFLSLAALETMDRGPGGALRIIAVSYPWLQPDHPDPHSQTLQLLARVLRAYVAEEGGTCGVFLDFCSLHQKGAGGEPRSEEETELFNTALGCLSDWYSHPKTVVLKLTKMPEGYPNGFTFAPSTSPNTADYNGRGWCFKESSVANLVKDYDFCLDLGRLGAETEGWRTIASECQAGRVAPLTPEDFFVQLEQKSFTSKKADLPTVSGLYKAAFDKRFGQATVLRYSGLGWGDAEMVLLSKVVVSGALGQLKRLNLRSNQIGDAGMSAFSDAIASGSLPALKEVVVDTRHERHPQLVAACKPRNIMIAWGA